MAAGRSGPASLRHARPPPWHTSEIPLASFSARRTIRTGTSGFGTITCGGAARAWAAAHILAGRCQRSGGGALGRRRAWAAARLGGGALGSQRAREAARSGSGAPLRVQPPSCVSCSRSRLCPRPSSARGTRCSPCTSGAARCRSTATRGEGRTVSHTHRRQPSALGATSAQLARAE